jgi:hypothetical protein
MLGFEFEELDLLHATMDRIIVKPARDASQALFVFMLCSFMSIDTSSSALELPKTVPKSRYLSVNGGMA